MVTKKEKFIQLFVKCKKCGNIIKLDESGNPNQMFIQCDHPLCRNSEILNPNFKDGE